MHYEGLAKTNKCTVGEIWTRRAVLLGCLALARTQAWAWNEDYTTPYSTNIATHSFGRPEDSEQQSDGLDRLWPKLINR